MIRYHYRMTALQRIFTFLSLLALFSLTSCAQFYSVPDQPQNRIARVAEGIYRGPRPDDLSELQTLGVRTILNLEDNSAAVRQEQKNAEQLNIEMINIPMSEIFKPRPADLMRAEKILEDKRFYPIYVHCLHGRDRTGFVIAAYRIIHQDWDVDRAYKEALDGGHNRWFYDSILGWKRSLLVIANAKAGAQRIP